MKLAGTDMQIASLIASVAMVIGTCAVAQEAGTATGQGNGAPSSDLFDAPAEAPPAEFSGAQYVDSRGCIFVRSEDQGREAWVPRIARSGQMICGAVPSMTAVAGQKGQIRPMALNASTDLPDMDAPLDAGSAPDAEAGSDATASVPTDQEEMRAASDADAQPGSETSRAATSESEAASEATQPIANIAGTPDPNGLPGKFVQAGSFRSEKTAQEVFAQISGTGLPVTIKRWRRGNVYYQVVLAGPLHGTVAQERGLRIVQGEGFNDAYLRD